MNSLIHIQRVILESVGPYTDLKGKGGLQVHIPRDSSGLVGFSVCFNPILSAYADFPRSMLDYLGYTVSITNRDIKVISNGSPVYTWEINKIEQADFDISHCIERRMVVRLNSRVMSLAQGYAVNTKVRTVLTTHPDDALSDSSEITLQNLPIGTRFIEGSFIAGVCDKKNGSSVPELEYRIVP